MRRREANRKLAFFLGAFYDQEAARLLNIKRVCRLLYLVAVGIVKKI
jgi:hypothetical protein